MSDQNAMRLEINYRKKKPAKNHKYVEAKQCVTKQWAIEEIKKKKKKPGEE